MTEKRLRELCSLWQERLGLDRWRLELRVEACDDVGSYMECERSIAHDRANITVAPWLLGRGEVPDCVLIRKVTDDLIEATLVHELLHCVVADMTAVVRDDLAGFLHRDVHAQVENAFGRAEEHTVDRLAEALVRSWV